MAGGHHKIFERRIKREVKPRSKTRCKARPWSAAELETLMRLADRHPRPSWREIAAHIPGRTIEQCCSRFYYMTSEKAQRPVSAQQDRITLDTEQERRRLERLAGYDARDLTQTFFGDPPRGFSALDERRQA